MVTRTEAAIIDLADSRKTYGDGVYALSHLDQLLGIEGLASDLQACRLHYRSAVDELLHSLCAESFPVARPTGPRPVAVEDDDTADDDSELIELGLARSSGDKRRSAPVERIRTAPVGLATLSPTTG